MTTLPRVNAEHDASLFQLSPLPMWTYDPATLRFVDVNQAAVRHYGWTRDEFLKMTLADIRDPKDVEAMMAAARQASGRVDRDRWRHRRKDGSTILVELAANDLNVGGRALRLVIVNDVTDRIRAEEGMRKAEEQLRHAQKMDALSRLASGISHDVNNVLTVISSHAQFLEDELGADDPRSSDATAIRRATERAAAIGRQLLTLSRRSTVTLVPLYVDDVIREFAPMLHRLLGKHIDLIVHESETPAILADRGQLEQVIMNLAINARDAMPEGGRLSIETSLLDVSDDETAATRGVPRGSYVCIAVTDTGSGMDRETQQRLFEPFFTTKPIGKGTGLGLAIVHGIVTHAGGAVTVYSEPGQGTTFRLHFPLARGQTTGQRVPPRDHAPLQPVTVLVADDDAGVRAATGRILRKAGCTVLEATSGDDARRIAVGYDGDIDIALVDAVLSDLHGTALIADLSTLRPAIKSVLMSGFPAGALADKHVSGPTLAKPFTPAELRDRLASIVSDDRRPRITEQHERRRLLLADDDHTLRRTYARLLRRSDFEVTEAADMAEALAHIKSTPFDVIVSDVNMPGGTGIDLLRDVRRVDLDVPMILISGQPDVRAAAAAIEHGAFRYLTKPLAAEALLDVTRHAARAHALARIRRGALAVTGGTANAAADRAGLEVRFESALERLWIAYQPIVDAKTSIPVAMEALVRSDEPSMSNPRALLEAAQILGRMPLLGRRVRSTAARDELAGELDLYVNLHPSDLLDADLVDPSSALARRATRIVLEITERTALASSPELTARLARIRELGFRIAVDDIGAGYSGLTTFAELQPEVVKIDMSLVRDCHQIAVKRRTIGALCNLCRESGALVVAEGVEVVAERECLVDLGCDLLQGYLFGRPARVSASV